MDGRQAQERSGSSKGCVPMAEWPMLFSILRAGSRRRGRPSRRTANLALHSVGPEEPLQWPEANKNLMAVALPHLGWLGSP